jgi:S-adenosylmethionine:tRNA ribosyltransferase-isomerase
MHLSELQYELPPELIAQFPAERRDASRLLVLDRCTGAIRHEQFRNLPELLPPQAMLVLNDTRVLPARLALQRQTGGRLEGLFMREPQPGTWEVMLTSSGRLKPGEVLRFANSPRELRLKAHIEAGVWHAEPLPPDDAFAILNEVGAPPLPPYIARNAKTQKRKNLDTAEPSSLVSRPSPLTSSPSTLDPRPSPLPSSLDPRPSALSDSERYQTIFARTPGAVAAPTAGLHFTDEVFAALRSAGIEHVFVTLHVGAGTFAPIRCEELAEHPMHSEHYELTPTAAEAINAARRAGRSIVAVGTTSVRVLETCAGEDGALTAGSGWTNIFIYPPYRLRAVDSMLTNFHLPGSTLLALVFALAGRDHILGAYEQAIREGYRFYSYGDAMLIR